MTLYINLGNFNVILFLVLVAAALSVAVVLSTPSLLHSVALYCLIRRDAILARRRLLTTLKERWQSEIPYPSNGEASPDAQVAGQPATAAGR